MASDLVILQQMIQDAAQVTLQDNYGKNIVTLVEPQCPDSSVTIYGMPHDAIVINVDDYWSLDKMFTHAQGQCKRADFIIVADNGVKKVILYIEMKRTKAPEREIIQQLTGAQCFVACCREIGKARAFWNQRTFLDEYEERFVTIGGTSIAKTTTRWTTSTDGIHSRPDKMLKISSPHHLNFNRLAGTEK